MSSVFDSQFQRITNIMLAFRFKLMKNKVVYKTIVFVRCTTNFDNNVIMVSNLTFPRKFSILIYEIKEKRILEI